MFVRKNSKLLKKYFPDLKTDDIVICVIVKNSISEKVLTIVTDIKGKEKVTKILTDDEVKEFEKEDGTYKSKQEQINDIINHYQNLFKKMDIDCSFTYDHIRNTILLGTEKGIATFGYHDAEDLVLFGEKFKRVLEMEE